MSQEQVTFLFDKLFILFEDFSDAFLSFLLSQITERFLRVKEESIFTYVLVEKVLKCCFHKTIAVKLEALRVFEKHWDLIPSKKRLLVAQNLQDLYIGGTREEIQGFVGQRLCLFSVRFKEFYDDRLMSFSKVIELLVFWIESDRPDLRALFVLNYPGLLKNFPDSLSNFIDEYFACANDDEAKVRLYWLRTFRDVVSLELNVLFVAKYPLLECVECLMIHEVSDEILSALVGQISFLYSHIFKFPPLASNTKLAKEEKRFLDVVVSLFKHIKVNGKWRSFERFYAECFEIWRLRDDEKQYKENKSSADKPAADFLIEFLYENCLEDYKNGNFAVQKITLRILVAITSSTKSIKERVLIFLRLQDEFVRGSSPNCKGQLLKFCLASFYSLSLSFLKAFIIPLILEIKTDGRTQDRYTWIDVIKLILWLSGLACIKDHKALVALQLNLSPSVTLEGNTETEKHGGRRRGQSPLLVDRRTEQPSRETPPA